MDLRTEKTEKSIINAFLALRAKKALEKITIKELCEQAMINKSTFYSHYADIYALSDALETQAVASVLDALDHPGLLYEHPEEFTRELFLGCLSQNHLIHILFSGSRSGQLISKVEAGIKELVFQAHPEYRDDLSKNVGISYSIYGAYFSFIENQHYGQEQVIELLGKISQYALDLLQRQPE